MKKYLLSLVSVTFLLLSYDYAYSQDEVKGGSGFLPYRSYSHTAFMHNSYLWNPASSLGGMEESNVSLFYRNQWFPFSNNYADYAASYGNKWDSRNVANAMIFKNDVGLFSAYGVLGNYAHEVEITDNAVIRFGINVVLAYSTLNKSKAIAVDSGDPVLLNMKGAFIFNSHPGIDMIFSGVRIGVSADDIFNYSSSGGLATPFSKKTYSAHAGYRFEIMSSNAILDEAVFEVLARIKKWPNTFSYSAIVSLTMPNFGWVYAGYGRLNGVYAGIGFNIGPYFNIGVGYEYGIGAMVPNLGSSFQGQVTYMFGGDRHRRAKLLKKKGEIKAREQKARKEAREKAALLRAEQKARETEDKIEAQKRAAEKKAAEAEAARKKALAEAEAKKNAPATPEKTAIQQLEERLSVRTDIIGDEKIEVGYYVIIGVYRNGRNAFRQINDLRRKGYDVYGFVNPSNNMTYVHIGPPNKTPHGAEKIMNENVDNRIFDGLWVLKIAR